MRYEELFSKDYEAADPVSGATAFRMNVCPLKFLSSIKHHREIINKGDLCKSPDSRRKRPVSATPRFSILEIIAVFLGSAARGSLDPESFGIESDFCRDLKGLFCPNVMHVAKT